MKKTSVSKVRVLGAVLAAGMVLSSYAAVAEPFSKSAGAAFAARPYSSKIEKTACFGWGPFCPPGWVRTCGIFACRCRPCF